MITRTLVDHLIRTNIEDLPKSIVYEAKRSLLNWLGVAVGASGHPSVEKVLNVARLTGRSPQATIFGRKEKTDLFFAALVNGMSSHIHDFDDTLLETVLHPSAPVFPAILAYAEHYHKSGKEVLEAFILGVEVEARLAKALYPSHYWRGWHITGTVGAIGAAAAVAKLLNLDHRRFCYAIGLAATEPTGLREMFGTMTKPFHPGKAAMNGLLSALLAKEGFTSSEQSIEAKRGYGFVLSDDPKLDVLINGWGESWEIAKNSYKPFACGIVAHPAIHAAISVRQNDKMDPGQVDSILLEVHPLVKELTGKKNPKTGLEGKFSIYHCVAVGFMDQKAGVRQFTDERVNDERILSLRNKVTMEVNEQIKEDQVRIKVTTKTGEIIEEFIEHAIGSTDMPLSDDQLKEKFLDVTGDILSSQKKQSLMEQIFHFEQLDDLNAFFEIFQ